MQLARSRALVRAQAPGELVVSFIVQSKAVVWTKSSETRLGFPNKYSNLYQLSLQRLVKTPLVGQNMQIAISSFQAPKNIWQLAWALILRYTVR